MGVLALGIKEIVRTALQAMALYFSMILSCLLVFLFLFSFVFSKTASASGTLMPSIGAYYVGGCSICIPSTSESPTPYDAAVKLVSNGGFQWLNGWGSYTWGTRLLSATSTTATFYNCNSADCLSRQYFNLPIIPIYTCPANSISASSICTCGTGYQPDPTGKSCVAVPAVVCPVHASGTPCACDAGYKFDTAGTSCVSTCPQVGELSPLTDPVALDFENGTRWRPDLLTADYQFKLACVQKGISDRGGTSVGTSAYRPTQYQQHLYEIVRKNFDLSRGGYMSAHPGCQALRDEITREMGSPPGHGLRNDQRVAPPGSSRHESGTAFDLTPSRLTDAQLAPVYPGCGVSHTAVPGEPWHVQ